MPQARFYPDGRMLVPKLAEGDGVIGDGTEVLHVGDADYDKWLPFAAPEKVETDLDRAHALVVDNEYDAAWRSLDGMRVIGFSENDRRRFNTLIGFLGRVK